MIHNLGYFLCSIASAVVFFDSDISKILGRQGDTLQWTVFLKFDVQNSFARFSVTMNPSEAVLYAKWTGISPLSRHIESRSWRFQNIPWCFEIILTYINTDIVICRDCSWLKIVKILNQFCFERLVMTNGHLFKQWIAIQLQNYSYRTHKDYVKKSWGFFLNTL